MSHNETMLHLMDIILTVMWCIDNQIDQRSSTDYAGKGLDIFLRNWIKKAHKDLSGHICEYKDLNEERKES